MHRTVKKVNKQLLVYCGLHRLDHAWFRWIQQIGSHSHFELRVGFSL